jgi:4-amino-4-deoxy-L-arabinose transferase-like glycosyltransferase
MKGWLNTDSWEDVNIPRAWILGLCVFLLATGVIFSDAFRDDDFCRFDSAWFSTIAQNIAMTNDWFNPHDYSGWRYDEHPPLTFWLSAISIKLLGRSVFSAILPCLLLAIGTCVIAFCIGTTLKNDIVGFYSGIGLLLTRYVPRLARFVTNDVPLMFFVALAMLFLILAIKRHKSFYLLYGLSAGFAAISKGAPAILIIAIGIITIIIEKKYADLWSPYFIGGIIVFAIPPALWLFFRGGATIAGAYSAFTSYQSFASRAAKGGGQYGDPGSVVNFILKLFEFCWIIMPAVVIGSAVVIYESVAKKTRMSIVLIVWALVFIVSYSMAKWRRGAYLLPIYPSLSVLFGIGLYKIIPRKYTITAIVVGASFLMGSIVSPYLFPHWEPKTIQEIIFKNTYLPGATKAVDEFFKRAGPDAGLAGYDVNDAEFYYFFGDKYKTTFFRNAKELDDALNSNKALLICISKAGFSRLDKDIRDSLRIVYDFSDKLLVTNVNDMPALWEG